MVKTEKKSRGFKPQVGERGSAVGEARDHEMGRVGVREVGRTPRTQEIKRANLAPLEKSLYGNQVGDGVRIRRKRKKN